MRHRVRNNGDKISFARLARGGGFTFTLTVPAVVEIAIERQRTRFQSRGTLHRDGQAEDNTVPFTGRIGRKALPPGRYRATLTAANAIGASAPVTTTFRVRK